MNLRVFYLTRRGISDGYKIKTIRKKHRCFFRIVFYVGIQYQTVFSCVDTTK